MTSPSLLASKSPGATHPFHGLGRRRVGQASSYRHQRPVLGAAFRGRPDAERLADLRHLSDGEEDFAVRLWTRHRSEVRVLLLGLVRAVGAEDPQRARACIHTLRGGLSFFGALRLDRLGHLLGQHLRQRGTTGCLPLLVAFLAEADRISATLDHLGDLAENEQRPACAGL